MLKDLLDVLALNPMLLAAGAAGGPLRALSSRSHSLRERLVQSIYGALLVG